MTLRIRSVTVGACALAVMCSARARCPTAVPRGGETSRPGPGCQRVQTSNLTPERAAARASTVDTSSQLSPPIPQPMRGNASESTAWSRACTNAARTPVSNQSRRAWAPGRSWTGDVVHPPTRTGVGEHSAGGEAARPALLPVSLVHVRVRVAEGHRDARAHAPFGVDAVPQCFRVGVEQVAGVFGESVHGSDVCGRRRVSRHPPRRHRGYRPPACRWSQLSNSRWACAATARTRVSCRCK